MTDLFNIDTTPYKGLRSDAHPLALNPGEAFDAVNVRCERGTPISVRRGIDQELDTYGLPANAQFYGASPVVKVQDGFFLLYLAAKDPADGKIHIYNRQYTTASGWGSEWHELTQTSGPFGDTRLSVPTSGLVKFTPVDSDPEARTHLNFLGSTNSLGPAVIVQNGIDLPLRAVGFPDASITQYRLVPITPIEAPTQARSMLAVADVFDSLPVGTGAVTTAATPGGTFTAATGGHVLRTGSAGSYAWEWKTGTSVTVGHTGEVVMDSEVMEAFAEGRSVPQIGIVVDAEDASWWDCIRVWAHVAYDGGAFDWELVHDPLADRNNRVHVPTNVDATVVSAFTFPRRTSDLCSQIEVNGLRIEVANDRLTPESKFIVRWVYASGWVPGTAQYAVSRKAALNEAESGGVIVASGGFGLDTTAMRSLWASHNDQPSLDRTNARFVSPLARGGGSVPPDFVFPIDPRLFYLYRVPVVNPTIAELGATFAETWSVYRKDPGEDDFLLVQHVQVGEWAGDEWALSLDPEEGGLFTVEDVSAPEDRDVRRRAPDAFNGVTPVGLCSVFANKRLYVGESLVDASGTNRVTNVVRISEEGQPARFRSRVLFDGLADQDPSSGFEARLGVEDVRALVAVDGSRADSSVFCLTERSLYAIDRSNNDRLFNVRRVAPYGAHASGAAVEVAGRLLWLDHEKRVRSSHALDDLSYGKVQSRLDESDTVHATAHKGRLYMARPGNRVLVYHLLEEYWESDDALPDGKSAEQFVAMHADGDARLLYFAPDCACYEFEAQGAADDDGDSITFALETGAHHNAMFLPVAAHNVAVVASTNPAVLTTKRVFSEPAATVTGEIDLDTGGALAWKYDSLPGGGVPGGEGQAVRVRIEADFEQPFDLLALAAQIKQADLGGARV